MRDDIEELKSKYPNGIQIGEYWNAIEWRDDSVYRRRLDVLVVNKDGRVFLKRNPDNGAYVNPLKNYRIPGGSFERNKTMEEVAYNVCQETVGLRIKNIQNTGFYYITEFPPDKDKILKELKDAGLPVKGGITYILIAECDMEDGMYNDGGWYTFEFCKEHLMDEHIEVLNAYVFKYITESKGNFFEYRDAIKQKFNFDIGYFKRTLDGGLNDRKGHKDILDFDLQQILWGIEIEAEHTDEVNTRLEIALDHLEEDPYYYTKLRKMEGLDESTINVKFTYGVRATDYLITDFDEFFNKFLKDKIEWTYLYVYFTGSFTTFDKAIRRVTNDPFSHIGICFDRKLDTMISFSSVSNGLQYENPLLTFSNRTRYELYKVKVTRKQVKDILKFVKIVSKNNRYNYEGILISHLLGFKTTLYNKRKGKFKFTCSQFTFHILNNILEMDFVDELNPYTISAYDILKFSNKAVFKFMRQGNMTEDYLALSLGIDGLRQRNGIIKEFEEIAVNAVIQQN